MGISPNSIMKIVGSVNSKNAKAPAILFVDDEEDILKSLARALRNEPYQQYYVLSAQDALDLMTQKPIQVLVSDMRMPRMDGVALLEMVARRYPDTIRMVISGWADADTILDAVNNGHIYRYLVKPWDTRELKLTLRQALEMYRLQSERKEMIQTLKAHNLRLEQTIVHRTKQIMTVSQQAQIGKYASQIVHSLNTPLNQLAGAVEVIGLMASSDPLHTDQIRKEVTKAQQELDRLKQIVKGLGNHAQEEKTAQLQLVDVNRVIEEEMEYFELDPFFHYEIQKMLRLAPKLPEIVGNAIQLKQIIDHLIKNALDAMAVSSEKKLSIETVLQNNTIMIHISDTGIGIAKESQAKIFSEGYTTKPNGKGTGLGLFETKSLVSAYSGSIDFTSTFGTGTTFTVTLPVGRETKISAGIGK